MYKDEILDDLASRANVAQFVSFSPSGEQRFSYIFGYDANHKFGTLLGAIIALLEASLEKSINVRSFRPDQPQGNEFFYGIQSVDEAFALVSRLSSEGFFTIVNETIDVDDGGVSGVLQGGCIEFSPGVVPRFVENHSHEPIPTIPQNIAIDMLSIVYGFIPDLDYEDDFRVEFSIHPRPRGWRHGHTIIWEEERVQEAPIKPFYSWPNPFSRMLGDKVYGLLLAHLLGAPVPRATVFPRNSKLGLFTFGTPTGSTNFWTRTCPKVQEPGRFTTMRKWADPFVLMDSDDPEGYFLASCIVQEEVESKYSGALFSSSDDSIVIEGVEGFGDRFMQGLDKPEVLPPFIGYDLNQRCIEFGKTLGPVRLEWAHDGVTAWVLQLHKGLSVSKGRVIFPGEPNQWLDFYVENGLANLRDIVEDALELGAGIVVHGNVGMSSHIADVLRKAMVPSVIELITGF